MSVALCIEFPRSDGTKSGKMVSLEQFRALETGWIRVVGEFMATMSDEEIRSVASRITDAGDQQLFREALVEHVKAREAA